MKEEKGLISVCDKHHDNTSKWVLALEAVAAAAAVSGLLALAVWPQYCVLQLTRGYAALGSSSAQHLLGQRYYQGVGVKRNRSEALRWFRRAADGGHAQAAFNLAVGHLLGWRSGLKHAQIKKYVMQAVRAGVPGAEDLMRRSSRDLR